MRFLRKSGKRLESGHGGNIIPDWSEFRQTFVVTFRGVTFREVTFREVTFREVTFREVTFREVTSRLEDHQTVLHRTGVNRRSELVIIEESFRSWQDVVKKEKMVYETLNLFNGEVRRNLEELDFGRLGTYQRYTYYPASFKVSAMVGMR